MKKKETDLQKIYRAAFNCAVEEANAMGVSKHGRKKFINDNTRFIYYDCKKNPKLKKYILDTYGDK